MKLDFRIEIFKEDDLYVAVAPELNVSSFGKTQKEAKASLREAVELFLEECKRMGTLDDVIPQLCHPRVGGDPIKRSRYTNLSSLDLSY